ncbi:MAG: hypothetical protein RL499_1395 [Actinomycetota bacterium]
MPPLDPTPGPGSMRGRAARVEVQSVCNPEDAVLQADRMYPNRGTCIVTHVFTCAACRRNMNAR